MTQQSELLAVQLNEASQNERISYMDNLAANFADHLPRLYQVFADYTSSQPSTKVLAVQHTLSQMIAAHKLGLSQETHDVLGDQVWEQTSQLLKKHGYSLGEGEKDGNLPWEVELELVNSTIYAIGKLTEVTLYNIANPHQDSKHALTQVRIDEIAIQHHQGNTDTSSAVNDISQLLMTALTPDNSKPRITSYPQQKYTDSAKLNGLYTSCLTGRLALGDSLQLQLNQEITKDKPGLASSALEHINYLANEVDPSTLDDFTDKAVNSMAAMLTLDDLSTQRKAQLLAADPYLGRTLSKMDSRLRTHFLSWVEAQSIVNAAFATADTQALLSTGLIGAAQRNLSSISSFLTNHRPEHNPRPPKPKSTKDRLIYTGVAAGLCTGLILLLSACSPDQSDGDDSPDMPDQEGLGEVPGIDPAELPTIATTTPTPIISTPTPEVTATLDLKDSFLDQVKNAYGLDCGGSRQCSDVLTYALGLNADGEIVENIYEANRIAEPANISILPDIPGVSRGIGITNHESGLVEQIFIWTGGHEGLEAGNTPADRLGEAILGASVSPEGQQAGHYLGSALLRINGTATTTWAELDSHGKPVRFIDLNRGTPDNPNPNFGQWLRPVDFSSDGTFSIFMIQDTDPRNGDAGEFYWANGGEPMLISSSPEAEMSIADFLDKNPHLQLTQTEQAGQQKVALEDAESGNVLWTLDAGTGTWESAVTVEYVAGWGVANGQVYREGDNGPHEDMNEAMSRGGLEPLSVWQDPDTETIFFKVNYEGQELEAELKDRHAGIGEALIVRDIFVSEPNPNMPPARNLRIWNQELAPGIYTAVIDSPQFVDIATDWVVFIGQPVGMYEKGYWQARARFRGYSGGELIYFTAHFRTTLNTATGYWFDFSNIQRDFGEGRRLESGDVWKDLKLYYPIGIGLSRSEITRDSGIFSGGRGLFMIGRFRAIDSVNEGDFQSVIDAVNSGELHEDVYVTNFATLPPGK